MESEEQINRERLALRRILALPRESYEGWEFTDRMAIAVICDELGITEPADAPAEDFPTECAVRCISNAIASVMSGDEKQLNAAAHAVLRALIGLMPKPAISGAEPSQEDLNAMRKALTGLNAAGVVTSQPVAPPSAR